MSVRQMGTGPECHAPVLHCRGIAGGWGGRLLLRRTNSASQDDKSPTFPAEFFKIPWRSFWPHTKAKIAQRERKYLPSPPLNFWPLSRFILAIVTGSSVWAMGTVFGQGVTAPQAPLLWQSWDPRYAQWGPDYSVPLGASPLSTRALGSRLGADPSARDEGVNNKGVSFLTGLPAVGYCCSLYSSSCVEGRQGP